MLEGHEDGGEDEEVQEKPIETEMIRRTHGSADLDL
jgi:hypothetical protein